MKMKSPIVTNENRDDLRYRCQTDLFFLTRDVLGYDKLIPRVHRPMAEFFVQKRPKLPLEEQHTTKKRKLLYPRYSYKSTLNVGDMIQWLCCFPNMVIFPVTAGVDLADSFVGEVQQHLTKTPDGKEPRLFEHIFPEMCIPKKKFMTGVYWHPARTVVGRKEPTILTLSPGMNISGYHCHLMDEDDCVNNKNTRTLNGLTSTITNLAVTRDMLDPDGYHMSIGTPYSPLDAHAHDLRHMVPGSYKLLRAPAWKVREEHKYRLKDWPINHPLPEECYDLLFPEKLSYKFLCEKMAENFTNFCAQYLLDPQGASGVTFTDDMLKEATVAAREIRPWGETRQVWVVRGDAVAGITAIYEENRMAVMDQVEGRFLPSQLTKRILASAKKWGCHDVYLLKTAEAWSLNDELRGAAYRAQWTLNVIFLDEEKPEAMVGAIKGLESHMSARRLIFADNIPAIETLYDHFQQYQILDHREIAEAVALLARWMPKQMELPAISHAQIREQRDEAMRKQRENEMYDMEFGLGKYAPVEPMEAAPKLDPEKFGLVDDLGGMVG